MGYLDGLVPIDTTPRRTETDVINEMSARLFAYHWNAIIVGEDRARAIYDAWPPVAPPDPA